MPQRTGLGHGARSSPDSPPEGERRCADSLCELGRNGPAARSRVVILVVTSRGAEHLQEWIPVSNHMSKSMNRFVREARTAGGGMAFRQKTNRDVEVEC